jgi:hypothetical protein
MHGSLRWKRRVSTRRIILSINAEYKTLRLTAGNYRCGRSRPFLERAGIELIENFSVHLNTTPHVTLERRSQEDWISVTSGGSENAFLRVHPTTFFFGSPTSYWAEDEHHEQQQQQQHSIRSQSLRQTAVLKLRQAHFTRRNQTSCHFNSLTNHSTMLQKSSRNMSR